MTSWADYLRNHPDATQYSDNAKSIAELQDHAVDPTETFLKVAESPTLVVISRDPIDNGVQSVFNLFTLGNKILKQTKKFGALMGFGKRAVPVRIDPKALFKYSSSERPIPSFKELLMINTTEEVEKLTGTNNRSDKMRIPNHAILPPSLSEILLDTSELEAKDLIQVFAETIRRIIVQDSADQVGTDKETVQTENSEESSTSDTSSELPTEKADEADPFLMDLSAYEEAYYKILVFLWAMIHDQRVVPGSPLTPALDEASTQYTESIHKKNFREHKEGKDLDASNDRFDTTGLQAVLSEFGSRIDRNTAVSASRKSEKDKDKEDSDWMKLTPLSRNVLEGMQAKYNTNVEDDDEEDIIIPSGPNTEQRTIIQCSTGARVQQYLNHLLVTVYGCVVCVGMGMCTAIKNGLLMSQPTPYEPTNYSPHFTPPATGEGLSSESQLRIEEQARNGKLTSEDMILITQQKIKSPTNYNELRHYIKNFHCLNKAIAGAESILEEQLGEVTTHVSNYETDYVFHFNEFPLFGAWFINKIHVGVQRYLHSCALGIPSKLDTTAIDFSDMIRSIQNRSIAFVRAPSYVKDQLPNRNKGKRRAEENEDEGPRTKKGKGNKNRDNKVTNDEQDAQAKLGHGMVFGEVFCREVRDGTNQPRMDDGTEMCNRFYGKGYCFQNCRRSHNKKNSAEQTRWKKFLQNVIARYKAKRDGREMPAPVTTSE